MCESTYFGVFEFVVHFFVVCFFFFKMFKLVSIPLLGNILGKKAGKAGEVFEVLEKVSTVVVGIVAQARVEEEAAEFAQGTVTIEKSTQAVATDATPGRAALAKGIVVVEVTVGLETGGVIVTV